MAVRMVHLVVARDAQVATMRCDEPSWVLPVMEEVFGAGNVVVQGEWPSYSYPVPDAQDEYARLEKVYGGSGNPKVPHVEKVYGVGRIGWQNLQKEIDNGVIDVEPENDPLLG